MTRVKIVKEKYSAVFNSALADKNRRIAEIKTPQKLPAIRYIRFCVQGIHYQFRAMPFGLATAPRLFTKVMSTVGSYLRKQQIYIHMYLDDWLVKHQDRSLLIQHRTMIINLLQRLGLLINHEKSRLNPTQTLEYLGALFKLKDGIIYPTEIRFLSLQQEISLLTTMTSVPAHKFLRLLGLMAACIYLVPLARLHMRPLQLYFLSFWRPYKDSLETHIPIRDPLLQHAHWWLMRDNIFRGTPLHIPSEVVLWTDASLTGWGAHMGNHQASGVWTAQQQTWHINMLEMKAVELALHHFQQQLQRKAVLLRCDNSTVVAYINKQGGGDEIPSTVSVDLGCISVGQTESNLFTSSPHSGEKEYFSGRLVEGSSRCENDRVELTPGSCGYVVSEVST